MVRSKIKMKVKSRKKTKMSSYKKKQELKIILNKLYSVIPCKSNDRLRSTDVVFKAVQYINQVHKKVAEEKGIEALHRIQQIARKKALKQFMSMKIGAKSLPQVSKLFSTLKNFLLNIDSYNKFVFNVL